MTDLAWMKTYIGTETALTAHLSPEEFGCFERLRRHYWQHGSLPEDEARLLRIVGLDLDRWQAVALAIRPLLAEALPKLDMERTTAATKREKKVAAGQKGAAVRWQTDSNTIANANGKTIADGMAEPSVRQWPSASASEEVRYEERSASMRTHAREPAPHLTSRLAAGQWLTNHADLFPGDPGFDAKVDSIIAGTLTWDDLKEAAA